jgi:glycosyltransferase involved in cell wall biosynthesis
MKTLIIAEFGSMGGTRTYFLRIVDFFRQYGAVIPFVGRQGLDDTISRFLEERNVEWHPLEESRTVEKRFTRFLGERIYGSLNRRIGDLLRLTGLPASVGLLKELRLLTRLVARHQPDLVVVSSGGGARFFSALFLASPALVVTHSELSLSPFRGFSRFIFEILMSRKTLKNKEVLFVSDHARNIFEKHEKAFHQRIRSRTVPNHGGALSDSVRRTRSRTPGVLTLGHVTGYKNPLLWAAVAKQVVDALHGNIQFTWAGDGNLMEQCRAAVAAYPTIRFIGVSDDVDGLYRSADIYFQPSLLESQGIGVVEAMKWSLPCIVSQTGGLVESVRENENGHLVDPSDTTAMARRLVELANDERLREQFGRVSRKIFEEKFCCEVWQARMKDCVTAVRSMQ